MKAKTNKSDLYQALCASFKAAPAKASFPIMEDFLLDVNDGKMEVTATDGSMTIVATAVAEGEGKTCINAKMLLDAVKLLPDTDIEISADNGTAEINYGSGKFSIPCFGAEDFPDVSVETENETVIASDDLKSALTYVLPCVAKDPMRPQLNGVFFNPVDGGYDIVATETRALAVQTVACEPKTKEAIIPTAAAAFIKDNLKSEGEVLFGETESKAVFTFEQVKMSVTKVVGAFPKYQAVIPIENENKLDAPTEELLSSVRRVATCANKASNAVKFNLSALGGATIEAQDLGFGCAAKEDMGFIKYDGADLVIGFKHDLLANLLAAIDEADVTMSFSHPKGAVLITTENENRKALLMPVAV